MGKSVMISVLECDNHIDPDRSKWGGYGPLVSKWLRSDHCLRERAQIRNTMDYPKLGDYDVIIITGAREPRPQELLKRALTNSNTAANPEGHKPWLVKLREYINKEVETTSTQKFVGFCFGHQILATAYGLSVECSDSGYEFSATTIQLSDTGKTLFGQDSICLDEGHQFQVKDQDLGQLQNLGSTDHTHTRSFSSKTPLVNTSSARIRCYSIRSDTGICESEIIREGIPYCKGEKYRQCRAASCLEFISQFYLGIEI
ncbi:unnamed protein product [Fusarium fujikuroi]|uniref:Glutamine amidotransferase domain-containing protein n=1 Tax=Fusarium fujikuroi TaxID=5127 RepID=A0A9Q9RDQ7_FUSFU|nr:unnamed protein product [Fusarium fujikuroi]